MEFDPEPNMSGVPIKLENLDIDTHRRKTAMGSGRQKLEFCYHKPRNANNKKLRKGQEDSSFKAFRASSVLA